MKYLFISLLSLLFSITAYTQINSDSSITIKVFGNCIQCKTRIEAAIKTKGVKNAVWSIETKLLKLQ